MRKYRLIWAAALAVGCWASPSRGQAPAVPAQPPPAAPPAAVPAAAPVAPAPPAAAPQPGLFARMCAGLDNCRRKLCKTPMGQMLNSMTLGPAMMTGGVIPPFCPLMPSLADMAQPGVAGAAAQAKADALAAKARREAVRYLGTLDCRYYPDAEVNLIAALRTDPVECVRLEAAMALGHGCCCTRRTIEALDITVSGSDRDGNPVERSDRVRDAAYFALSRCLACYHEVKVTPLPEAEQLGPPREEVPREKEVIPVLPGQAKGTRGLIPGQLVAQPSGPDAGRPANRPGSNKPDAALIERARKTVAEYEARRSAAVASPGPLPRGSKDLYHILKFAENGATEGAQPVQQSAPQVLPAQPTMPAQPAVLPRQVMPVRPMQTPQPPLGPQTRAPVPAAPRTLEIISSDPSDSGTVTVKPASYVAPAQPARDPAILKQLQVLHASPNAADKHAAVRFLANCDWQKHPEAVAGMVQAARQDAAAAVRVDCLRRLVAMRASEPYVLTHVRQLTADPDPWVRQEATQALGQLEGTGGRKQLR